MLHQSVSNKQSRMQLAFMGKFGAWAMMVIFCFMLCCMILGEKLLSPWLFARMQQTGDLFYLLLARLHTPPWFSGLLVDGVYRTIGWVLALLLPPIAVFFLFVTTLEEAGIFPRGAFSLDEVCRKLGVWGQQGIGGFLAFGCREAAMKQFQKLPPRERFASVFSCCIVPSCGKFPVILTCLAVIFETVPKPYCSFWKLIVLCSVLFLCIVVHFGVANLLSRTWLWKMPSWFLLEIPPLCLPQMKTVLYHGVFRGILPIMGRGCMAALPGGLLLWLMTQFAVGEQSVLEMMVTSLSVPGEYLGMDGVWLLAFLLGFFSDSLVLPAVLLCQVVCFGENLLLESGADWKMAVCVLVFTLFHFPCMTDCMAVYKEIGSIGKTVAAMALPTVLGIGCCILLAKIVFCII